MSKGPDDPLILIGTKPLIVHRLPPEEVEAMRRAMNGEGEDMQREVNDETIELRYEVGNGTDGTLVRAALVTKTASGVRVFRGKWVDSTADALRTLIQELGESLIVRQTQGSLDQAAELRRIREESRALRVKVADQKAKLLRIDAALGTLIEAVGEPEN